MSAFYVDADVVFLQDPTPYLKKYSGYDLATSQQKRHRHCAGMYLAAPTPKTVELFRKLIEKQKRPGDRDQNIFNNIIKTIKNLSIANLDPERFYDGLRYFGHAITYIKYCCSFVNGSCCPPRSKVLALHDNFSGTRSVKIYKFKEQLLWFMDKTR